MTRVRYLSSYLDWVSHQDFKNIAYVGFFRHFVCVFVFVVVFVIVFVFVFVSSYDFWIAFIISFQNMYGYRGLWSLRAEIMVIFEVMTDTHTDSKSTYRLSPSGRMGRVKNINLGHLPWGVRPPSEYSNFSFLSFIICSIWSMPTAESQYVAIFSHIQPYS